LNAIVQVTARHENIASMCMSASTPKRSHHGDPRLIQPKAGLALDPKFTVSRTRASWTAMSDDPTYLAQLERYLEGMRKAGVPEQ
jgi:hypothetical protein